MWPSTPPPTAAVEEEILSDAAGLLSYADEKECTQAPEETDTPSPDAPELPSILDLLYPLDAPSANDDTNDDAQKK